MNRSNATDETEQPKHAVGWRARQRQQFLLSLRRKPAAAVVLILLFMVLAVAVVGMPSHGSAKFWHPAIAWGAAIMAIGAAAYLTAAVYLVQEPGAGGPPSDGLRELSAGDGPDRGADLRPRMRVTGPILMLDIDGVLHMGQSGRLNKMPLLQQWLYEHPSVQVIVSSDWRYTHGFDEILKLFDDELRDRVVGSTPIFEGAPREVEILHLVNRWNIKVWAALDDVAEGFPSTAAEHLILTNPLFGVSESDLVMLAERLGV